MHEHGNADEYKKVHRYITVYALLQQKVQHEIAHIRKEALLRLAVAV
jgi:hypothetical protein